uniref:Cortactin-binding protein 2 n=1 Tax=Gadus morhua TaxID=8049 RepID=A0A8C4ZZ69_GADMO
MQDGTLKTSCTPDVFYNPVCLVFFQKCEFNMDSLSKPELLTLLSIMEGELEARDLVIETLRARRKEVFLQERYGQYSLTDPFLALQRDFEGRAPGPDKDRRPLGSSPVSVLEAVMAHCRKMQERMAAQLANAETRQKRLEMEKQQLQSLELDHRKLTAQLKDEREKNKHIVMMLVRECKQLATRVVEESQRFDELQARLDEEGGASARLGEELAAARQSGQQMEAKMEKQLSELDTEREQLRARLGREETECLSLRRQLEQLRTPPQAAAAEPEAAATFPPMPLCSVGVATEPISSRTASCQTDPPLAEPEGPKKTPLSIPVKPGAGYAGLSLPRSGGRGMVHSSSGGLAQTENGAEGAPPHGAPSGVSPRVQAARYKFQEQDQNGSASQSPPSRDLSPTNRDHLVAKQQARHTVTQVLSRFTSPPAGGAGRAGLPHSASEGGPFPGRLGHPIGLKSPTVARIDRGNPPPIPPKKPGLSQTPSPPHPPIKAAGDSGRSPGAGLKPATPQLPPKPAMDLVPALPASQVGAPPPPAAGGGPRRSPSIPPPSSSASPSSSAPCSCSPTAPADCPLAPASGWRPSVASCRRRTPGGGPADLDSRSPALLLQAASQGNVTLLSMLLNPPDPTETPRRDPPDAHDPHPDCVQLLLLSGASADFTDENGFTPLHLAAAHGHRSCVEALLDAGAPVDPEGPGGHTPLHLASQAGCPDCVRVLLGRGADRSQTTTDGCTVLHAAVRSGHVPTLRLLLCRPLPGEPAAVTFDPCILALPADLLNRANTDGWTAAHTAASRGLKECLEVLCSYTEQDIERRDECNRTIHDVATDDCKDLLENLLEGSCQEHIANQIARCIKAKQEAEGRACDVIRVEVDESLTKEQLLETFMSCGPHYFREGCFLIGTLSKPHLQGCELRLQQHFRWVTLRWEQEPLHGLLGRHLRRKLLHKVGTGLWAPAGLMERSVLWVCQVWQQLNACVSRLGCPEALLGPQLFLSCPLVPHTPQATTKWLGRLWNAIIVPRVEEAMVSRVTAGRPSPSSPKKTSPSNQGLSPGQQAVVKAALSILLNKAVVPGCPLPRAELDPYLVELRGGTFPLSAIGSCRGTGGSERKGRASGMWRRANTSPRKKTSSSSGWSSGGSFREGSLSSVDVSLTNGNNQRSVGHEETDLIRELQSMCTSKSEPDISKVHTCTTRTHTHQPNHMLVLKPPLPLLHSPVLSCCACRRWSRPPWTT